MSQFQANKIKLSLSVSFSENTLNNVDLVFVFLIRWGQVEFVPSLSPVRLNGWLFFDQAPLKATIWLHIHGVYLPFPVTWKMSPLIMLECFVSSRLPGACGPERCTHPEEAMMAFAADSTAALIWITKGNVCLQWRWEKQRLWEHSHTCVSSCWFVCSHTSECWGIKGGCYRDIIASGLFWDLRFRKVTSL